jgi:hypothetical protein
MLNPSKLDFTVKMETVDSLINKINNGTISLKNNNIWDNFKQSIFIESIIARIPIRSLSIFYNQSKIFEVMDGSNELNTLINFNKGNLKLEGLEYYEQYNGHNELPFSINRRLQETTLTIVYLNPGVPEEIVENYKKRIQMLKGDI